MLEPEIYRIHKSLNQTSTSYIYGEIESNTMYDIIKTMNYENCRFLDVGSGSGNVLMDLANIEGLSVCGIEIDEDRYKKSVQKMDMFENSVELIHNDFEKIYFGDYDIIYCCNCIFEDEDNERLYKKIIREFTGKCFLFTYDKTLLPYYVGSYIINTSWVKHTVLYYFEVV